MKTLCILLLISSATYGQVLDSAYYHKYSPKFTTWKPAEQSPAPKLFTISNNDKWVMGCFFMYGFAKGWADEVEYHHYELSQRFPGLFKNGSHFWDGRYDDDGIVDAKHMLAGIQASLMTAAVCIKIGDLKNYPKKHRFKKVVTDIIKYDFSRRLGFFLSYNVINQNKVF